MCQLKSVVKSEERFLILSKRAFLNSRIELREVLTHLSHRQLLVGLPQVLRHGVDDLLVFLGRGPQLLNFLPQGVDLPAVPVHIFLKHLISAGQSL